MMYNLFYLDDEKDDLIKPIIAKLESTGVLKVTWEKPLNFESEIDDIQAKLKDYDALILDLQLDGDQEDGKKVKYQAPPLAQVVRTLATEKQIADIPIILCSTDDRIRDSFKRDFTSHDLFDWIFLKNEIDSFTIVKICDLIEGYRRITKEPKDFTNLLHRDYSRVDDRILSRFINEDNPPVHEISRVVFKDIVQPTGILINEEILAARLGIDSKTSKDWNKLKDDIFIESKYEGVFSQGWSRWWSDGLIDQFTSLTGDHLPSLTAEDRVRLLNEKLGLELYPAKPLKFNHSTNYWTICVVTKCPIDPYEGYKVDMKLEPKPWQDYSYVSFFSIIERLAERQGVLIHPSEEERFRTESSEL